MQDDITDGVKAMTMGWADPERVCIVGWSYGGYAALAGGALTPDTLQVRRVHRRRVEPARHACNRAASNTGGAAAQ